MVTSPSSYFYHAAPVGKFTHQVLCKRLMPLCRSTVYRFTSWIPTYLAMVLVRRIFSCNCRIP